MEKIIEQAKIGNKMIIALIAVTDQHTEFDKDGNPTDGFILILRITHCEDAGCTKIDNWEIYGTKSEELLKASQLFGNLAAKQLQVEAAYKAKNYNRLIIKMKEK